jgi:arylsulfatase A-like enzyme
VRPAASAAPGTMRDIAPTLLALAGVEPPPFMEGRPFDL